MFYLFPEMSILIVGDSRVKSWKEIRNDCRVISRSGAKIEELGNAADVDISEETQIIIIRARIYRQMP